MFCSPPRIVDNESVIFYGIIVFDTKILAKFGKQQDVKFISYLRLKLFYFCLVSHSLQDSVKKMYYLFSIVQLSDRFVIRTIKVLLFSE